LSPPPPPPTLRSTSHPPWDVPVEDEEEGCGGHDCVEAGEEEGAATIPRAPHAQPARPQPGRRVQMWRVEVAG